MSRTWEAILCWAVAMCVLGRHALRPVQSFSASPVPGATIPGINPRRLGPDVEADTGGGEPASCVDMLCSTCGLGAVEKLRFALQGLVSELDPEPL